MSTGGSLDSITLDGRIFSVATDADVQRKLGGFETTVNANGNGTTRNTKTRVPWSLTGVVLDIDDDRGDQEFIQELQDRTSDFPIAATYVSGVVYQGVGQIVDEVAHGSQATTASIGVSGPGKFTKQ
jgi:hypothetical protein